IWCTDGTTKGTISLPPAYASQYWGSTTVNGIFYFPAGNDYSNHQLWRSDGSTDGTYAVTNFGSTFNYVDGITSLTNEVLFFVQNSSNKKELWKSDGTTGGTERVKTFE